MKTFLHVGCGPIKKNLVKGFSNDVWSEIRLDIDEKVRPDIIGSILDMHSVESGSVDAVYSSHNIEHVFPHEVPIALKEFHRVLKDNGIVVLTCPDLQRVCEAVVNDKLTEPLYETPGGHKICPIDSLYGWRGPIASGNHFMAHKTGFTYSVLNNEFLKAGFKMNYGGQVQAWNLFIVSFKQSLSEKEIKKVADPFFP